jgi:flagellin
MSLTISTNTSAATAHRYLRTNDMEASRSLAKLSSGSRIVRASDDAAGLAVGTKLRADVAALRQAQVNASHGSSVLQVADGALQQISDILVRMKALATQSLSGSISDTERGYLDAEYQELIAQIDQIAQYTTFNGEALLDGSFDVDFLVGLDETNDIINVAFSQALDTAGLSIAAGIDSAASATTALGEVNAAIDTLLQERATAGALMSRFDYAGANIATQIENMDAARSVLMDVDVAAEMSNFSAKQVLMQASVAMLAQANQMPQNLLRLLQ